MTGDRRTVRLEDGLDCLIDYRGKSPPKSPTGVPVISAKVVKDGRIIEPVDQKIDESYYPIWMTRGLPMVGDVIMTTEGPLGEIAQLNTETVHFALGQRVVCMRGKPGVVDSTFLKYLLMSPSQQKALSAYATGTTVAGISQKALRAIPIAVPDYPEQVVIGRILGSLDAKIELNRRMNETLEAMARALFESWFVDFDPVRAKAEGRNPGFSAPLVDFFPDGFSTSEIGEIPKAWRVVAFADLATLSRDQVNPLEQCESIFSHYSIPAFDNGQQPAPEYGSSIKSVKLRVPAHSVLFSKLNPIIERVWLVDPEPNELAVCSTEFLVLCPKSPAGRSFLYCLTRSDEFRQAVAELVTGTSNSHQRARADGILGLRVSFPPSRATRAFEGLATPILNRTLANRRESRSLAALRDTLLPNLISGELQVKDAERFVKRSA